MIFSRNFFIYHYLGVIVLFLFFSSCFLTMTESSGLDDQYYRYGGTLIGQSYADSDILNPVLSADSASSYIESFIFEGLLTCDKDGQIIPHLALGWDVSPNKLDYTFFLRQDVYWHDNESFTADDVIFTWDRILDPRTETTRASMFDSLDIENTPYEKIDDYTVIFHLKTTFSPMLTNMVFKIIPEHIFKPFCPLNGSELPYQFNDCPPNLCPIGTGSMMFDEWIRDDQIILIRNSQANGGPGYWYDHDAYLERYIRKIIPDMSCIGPINPQWQREMDIVDLTSTEMFEVNAYKEDPDFLLYYTEQCTSDHIAFNCDPSKGHHADTRDFTTDPNNFAGFEWMEDNPKKLPGPNIRKALNYALDKDHLIEIAYPHGYRNLGPMYRAQKDWYNEGVEHYDLDLNKSDHLLAEAGFGEDVDDPLRKELKFKISYNIGNIRRQTICNYAKSQWKAYLGVDVVVEKVEWKSMFESHYDHRMFDAMSAGWTSGGLDPDLTNVWHSKSIMPGGRPKGYNPNTYVWEWEGEQKNGGLNYMGYWNPEVDNLLDIARNEPEKTVRKVYYDQIQEKIVNDSPYIWLLAHVGITAAKSNIHGLSSGYLGSLWPMPGGFHNVWKSEEVEDPPIEEIHEDVPATNNSNENEKDIITEVGDRMNSLFIDSDDDGLPDVVDLYPSKRNDKLFVFIFYFSYILFFGSIGVVALGSLRFWEWMESLYQDSLRKNSERSRVLVLEQNPNVIATRIFKIFQIKSETLLFTNSFSQEFLQLQRQYLSSLSETEGITFDLLVIYNDLWQSYLALKFSYYKSENKERK